MLLFSFVVGSDTFSKFDRWDTRVFRDINRAIELCDLPSRSVRVKPNDPPQDYFIIIDPNFTGNESNCVQASNNASYVKQVVFAEQNETNPVRIFGCQHQLRACNVTFEGFTFIDNCGNSLVSTWNTNVPDPSPLPLPVLGLIDNTFDGQGTTAPAISGLVDDDLMIGDHSEGSGKQVFYLAIQQGNPLAPDRGNLFTNYNGPRVIQLVGRSCDVNMTVSFNVWDQCKGNCFNVTEVGGIDFDYNVLYNSGGFWPGEEAAVFVNVCTSNTTNQFRLRARWNNFQTDSSYNPTNINLTTGGYFTAFWFDPANYDLLDQMEIENNKGDAKGVCMRQDNRPDHSSLLDPQAEARKIGLFEHNLFCQGTKYDVRFLNGPAFDPTVDSDQVLYRKYYCNGMFIHPLFSFFNSLSRLVYLSTSSSVLFLVFLPICCRTPSWYLMMVSTWGFFWPWRYGWINCKNRRATWQVASHFPCVTVPPPKFFLSARRIGIHPVWVICARITILVALLPLRLIPTCPSAANNPAKYAPVSRSKGTFISCFFDRATSRSSGLTSGSLARFLKAIRISSCFTMAKGSISCKKRTTLLSWPKFRYHERRHTFGSPRWIL